MLQIKRVSVCNFVFFLFFTFYNSNLIAIIFIVKKAYHRLSLMVHPDRVQESQKLIATEKFKVLCKIHSILQNPEKRSIYDESGDVDDDCELDDSWMNYWKSIFRKITKEDIKKCEDEYIGSETEIRDLKKAYVNGKGSMNFIIQNVPFSNCDHEPRYIEIIRKLVDDGEVDEYEEFFNEPLKKKMRRKKKEEKERAEAEEMPGDFSFMFIYSVNLFLRVMQYFL